jgi:16S rRNA (cytosine967-C5)-methyltransferase
MSAPPPVIKAAVGLASRRIAIEVLLEVLVKHKPLDGALDRLGSTEATRGPHASDLALTRLIVATTLRRLGQLEDLLTHFIAKPLPDEAARGKLILLTAAAQLLFLGTPHHAAIDVAVTLCKEKPETERLAGLANAVLRKVATEGPALVAGQDAARLNSQDWLWERWVAAYGELAARAIALAHLTEAALDLTVKSDPEGWASRLGGVVTPTGSVRLKAKGRIETLEGFNDGACWVQDAAAALPVRLLGDVAGLTVADLCAAPGGKTAQLAAAGARVTAVDDSAARLGTLKGNLTRLGLTADVIQADAAKWSHGVPFDAILLDAPCLATGTIRRHPDLPFLKRPEDLKALAGIQAKLLDNAAKMLKPGGMMVYCTCSLEPEESQGQIARLLARTPGFELVPVAAGEAGIAAEWVTAEGYLRTLPSHLPKQPPELSGMDGFFAARLRRR